AEIDMIAHACGLRHARELRREHVRIVRSAYESVALSTLFPYPEQRVAPKPKAQVHDADAIEERSPRSEASVHA
ncbi:MAG: hypothetical protein KIS79_16005, partial [Burkholderiales bacterium]|nr:hypothetical protein [Burkholderiales bacterium]